VYNSFDQVCSLLRMHRGLFSVVGVLAVDTVLLVLMLTGLRRDAHERSMGVWHLLYNQVAPTPLPPLTSDTEDTLSALSG